MAMTTMKRQGVVVVPDFKPTLKPNMARAQQRAGLRVLAKRESGGRSYDGENARKSGKGQSYTNKNRRRGRPAWQRSPDDTPLRDGNRDRLMGLLTDRCVVFVVGCFDDVWMFGWSCGDGGFERLL